MSTLTITFDRIGRKHDVEPLHLTVPDVVEMNDLSAEWKGTVYDIVYDYVRPHLASRVIELMFDPPRVHILCGFRSGGTGQMTLS